MEHLLYSEFIKEQPKITNVDALFLSPHPDDVELFCGGTIAHLTNSGYKVAVIDLTRGEAASKGTPETRWSESLESSEILKLSARLNLEIPDTEVYINGAMPVTDQRERLTSAIRFFKPQTVFAPFGEERHPDHQGARNLFNDAAFFSGVLSKYKDFQVHHIPTVLYYMLRKEFTPDYVVPLTEEVYKTKMKAIDAYNSQVKFNSEQPKTLVSNPLSITSINARDSFFGSMIGESYGEAFKMSGPAPLKDPIKLSKDLAHVSRFIYP